MRIELDHLFVCTAPGAPEAEDLVRFGLREDLQIGTPGKAQKIDALPSRTP
jgi:hypothetical protein